MSFLSYGAQGERAAESYLVKRGAKVVARNFRCPLGEIDLIVRMDGCLVFVEVKRRGSDRYGRGAEAVDRAKQKHIIRAAQWYLKEQGERDARMRFDVIEVTDDDVRHIRAAFDGGALVRRSRF